jgi:hypothetical protein
MLGGGWLGDDVWIYGDVPLLRQPLRNVEPIPVLCLTADAYAASNELRRWCWSEMTKELEQRFLQLQILLQTFHAE